MSPTPPSDPWARLRQATRARIGLGRCGAGLPTAALLDFQIDHARARDAVHAALDPSVLSDELALTETLIVHSRAVDRTIYLQRPDLGRRLASSSESVLSPGPYDLACVFGDGLSATAVHRHAPPLLGALVPRLAGWRLAPVVIASQARVALGDEIGARLEAELVLVLIGERPGLSSPDSLGAYLTYAPRPGRLDSERNCVSNIRQPDGLGYDAAADKLVWLMTESRRRKLTGIGLKDDAIPVHPSLAPGGRDLG